MADNIVIGAGRLYVAELDADDNPGPERFLGDSVGASVTGGEGERLQVFKGDGSDSSQKLVDRLLDVSRSMSLTLHDLSLANIRLFVMGDLEEFTPAAVVDEQFPACKMGDEFQLGTYNGAAGAIGGGYVIPTPADASKITGKTGSAGNGAIAEGVIRYVPKQSDGSAGGSGDDVALNGAGGANPNAPKLAVYGDTGRVVVLTDDYAAAGFRLSYLPSVDKRSYVQSASAPVEGAVRYVEYDPREGVGRNVYITKATIRPNGEWPLKSRTNEQTLGLSCEALGKVYISEGVNADA